MGTAPAVPLTKPAADAGMAAGDSIPGAPEAAAAETAPGASATSAGDAIPAAPAGLPPGPWAPPATAAGDAIPVAPAAPAGDAATPAGTPPNPWAPPAGGGHGPGPGDTVFAGASGAPAAPTLHGQETVTSLSPFSPHPHTPPAWPAPTPPAGHTGFPAPPVGQGGFPVPPPPIAPDGPGQIPYGYPGAPAPVPYGAPPGYYGWPGSQPVLSDGMGTASLVLGILAAILFCLWPLAIVLGVLGVIFGAIGRVRARRGEASNPGQALAGIICGSVGVVLALVILAAQITDAAS
ncbi:DUF4190 domain-containing protein [Streptomyces sp. NPDC086787]|uniref:DUF4190 domain-containing protein n=1 Tax=Streptomyces sp. NPDC086787 TaxID=3365759 RepID=UPI00382CAF5B